MIDYKRIEEIYWNNDIYHGIPYDYFRKLAEEMFDDGYGNGYDDGYQDGEQDTYLKNKEK